MDSLDLFYRTFEEYKKNTRVDLECSRFQKYSRTLNKKEHENLIIYFSTVTIEHEWVEAIERGLPFIEKAIKEDRQFIRSEGEVTPIEKVKKVGKESIQDLAKHSSYITHLPDEGAVSDVIPDKLLIVKKDSDFAVYENRVIYATLHYLREFVSSRLAAIKEAAMKYESSTLVNKTIVLGNRRLEFEMNLHEKRTNDVIASRNSGAKDLIDRLDLVLTTILVLMKTPLMLEVSKVDLVKRPITKTNVLKMNRNFRESLALFDYIAEYNKPGYLIQTQEKSFNPFEEETVGDYTEVMMLTSYLSYMHSNCLENDLREAYKEEEIRRKKEQEEALLLRLRGFHAKANMEEKDINEYLLAYEDGYRILERKVDEHNKHILALKKEHEREIEELNEAHQKDIEELQIHHQKDIANQSDLHHQKIEKMEADFLHEFESQREEFESQFEEIQFEAEEKVKKMQNETRMLKEDMDRQILDMRDEINRVKKESREAIEKTNEEASKRIYETNLSADENIKATKKVCDEEILKLKDELERLTKERNEIKNKLELEEGENIIMRQDLNKPEAQEEFLSKERFMELERIKIAYDDFFENIKKAMKKKIKKDTYNELVKQEQENKLKFKKELEQENQKEEMKETSKEKSFEEKINEQPQEESSVDIEVTSSGTLNEEPQEESSDEDIQTNND